MFYFLKSLLSSWYSISDSIYYVLDVLCFMLKSLFYILYAHRVSCPIPTAPSKQELVHKFKEEQTTSALKAVAGFVGFGV